VKSVLTILIVFFILNGAQALPLKSINCVTEFPTISFVAHSIDTKNSLSVLFINHGGSQMIPIHSGIITKYDLTYLQNKATALEKLPNEFRFAFESKNCSLSKDGSFSCYKTYNSKDTISTETPLVPTSLRSSLVTTQLDDATYKEVELSMNLSDGINQYSVNAKYPESECQTNSL